jgi:hypothetical protein
MKTLKITNGETNVDIPIKKEYSLNGIKLFVHRPYNFKTGELSKEDGWNVSEYYTGLMIGGGATMNDAMLNAKIALEDHNILTPMNMIDFTKDKEKINL